MEMTGGDGAGYARELLEIAAEAGALRRPAAALLGAASPPLESRVRALLRDPAERRGRPLARRTRGLAVLAVVLAAAASASVDLVPGHGTPDAAEVTLRLAADPFPGD
jgi:hypothetical protein